MDDTVLDFRFGKYGFNRCRKPGQIVCAGDENVLNSAVFQAVEYRCPVFGAFIFTDPHARNVFPAVQINADGDIDCLLHDLPFAADMVVDGIQKNHCVDDFQRPLLPFFCDGENLVRNTAHGRVRYLYAADIPNVNRNIRCCLPLAYMDRIFSSMS